jgi:hypothetical protein
MPAGRIAKVVVGIAATSAAVGALTGVVSAAALLAVFDGVRGVLAGGDAYGIAAAIGAGCGVVLGPLASFGFLRRVPLGRLFLETALGTIAGGVVGLLLSTGIIGALGVATVGFAAAGARLGWAYRGRATRAALPAGDD